MTGQPFVQNTGGQPSQQGGQVTLDSLAQMMQQNPYQALSATDWQTALGLAGSPQAADQWFTQASGGQTPPGATQRVQPGADAASNYQYFLDRASATNSPQHWWNIWSQGGDANYQPLYNQFLTDIGNVQAKATGGPLDPNAMTLVGERGPEMITPAQGGAQQVIPLDPNMRPTDWGGGNQAVPNIGQFGSANQPQTPFQTTMSANPTQQTLNGQANATAPGSLGSFSQQLFGQNPGQGVVNAMTPVFSQNLQNSLQQLRNLAPSVYNSGVAIQGTDLARQALNDYNLLGAQALQQGVGQQITGAGTLGGLALGGQQLGENARQFNLNYDLAAQNQAYQQLMGPTLQMLLQALQGTQPVGNQVVVGSQKA